ncbi:MAG: hypothetical protein DCF13_07180 [Flavobacteriaceae bacterium]|nr:MAG: hypothetical protein DCF13_07180 [Flavobacteriaceae bacterium]
MIKNYSISVLFGKRVTQQWMYAFALLLTTMLFSTNGNAQTPCLNPINPMLLSVNNSSATIGWTHPSPAPWSGYDIWHTSIPAYTPTSSFSPSGSTNTNTYTLSGYEPGATIYVFVRSACGSQTGPVNGPWIGPITFTTIAPGSGCPNAPYGLHPEENYTPQYTQEPEVIVTDAYAGEFSRVNVIPNRQYVFSTSVSSDYITITNANSTSIIAHGPSPLTWSSTSTATIRYYINTNSSCGVQQTDRVRYITAQLNPSNCLPPINLVNSSISSTGAVLSWSFPGGFTSTQYYYSLTNTPPNINTTPTGSALSDNKVTLTTLTPNTTYYYWLRSTCSPNFSNWVSGGSFTTLATDPVGCNGNLYGQNPTTTYTPACFGNSEIIATNAWAGGYSKVTILPNKIYTFTSSVATDFITIKDDTTSFTYASGTTPLVWSSGANTATIRFSLNTNSSCGNQNVSRTMSIICQDSPTCTSPSSLVVSALTGTTAIINWTASNPAPSGGYQYYYSTSNVIPNNGTAPSGSVASTTLNLTGLTANTIYYIWVRSNCGGAQGNWVFGNSFTTVGAPSTGCVTALYGLYPETTFQPACFGATENIVTDAYAGEYSNIAIAANRQYTFASSVASDYVTISNADATLIYAAGYTPLVWTSGTNSGTIRFYLHTNTACGSQQADRTKTIICQDLGPTCSTPTSLTTSAITTSGATLNWVASNPVPSSGYDYYYSSSSTAPNGSTTPSGNTSSTNAAITGLTANTTYYFWVRANCGSSVGEWVSGNSFTTLSITICNTAEYGLYPQATYTPSCTGSLETIVTDAYAGEYANVSFVPNRLYTFSSSVATDYITITNFDGTYVYTSGTTPVQFTTALSSGTFRYYIHTNASCGSQTVSRIRYITCESFSNCNPPSNFNISNITSNSARIAFTASTSTGVTYDVYFNTTNTAPTSQSTPNGNVTATAVIFNNLTSNTTYYFWIRTNCGSSTSSWVNAGSFTTNAFFSCNSATNGLYPSANFSPSCSGSNETIVTDAYAGEFSNVVITSNRQYTFTSSVASDFITITNQAGTTLLASGTSPLIWNSGTTAGVVRYFIHTNASCGNQSQDRSRFVACSTTLGVEDVEKKSIKLYPNPTQSIVNIVGENTITKLEVVNSLGQQIKVVLTQSNQTQIDLSEFTKGVYFVKVYTEDNSSTHKIVKE